MNNYGEGRCFCCCEEEVRRGLLFWTVKTDEPNEKRKMGHRRAKYFLIWDTLGSPMRDYVA